jgi:hypothetical protein
MSTRRRELSAHPDAAREPLAPEDLNSVPAVLSLRRNAPRADLVPQIFSAWRAPPQRAGPIGRAFLPIPVVANDHGALLLSSRVFRAGERLELENRHSSQRKACHVTRAPQETRFAFN